MQKWEYRIWEGSPEDLTHTLNEAGENGWELFEVFLFQTEPGTIPQYRLFFKRPKE